MDSPMTQTRLIVRKKFYTPGSYSATLHRHHFWQIELTDKNIEVNLEERKVKVKSGNLLLIPPLIEHSVSYPENTCVKSIKFSFDSKELFLQDIIIVPYSKFSDITNALFFNLPFTENSYINRLTCLYLEIFMLTCFEKQFSIDEKLLCIANPEIRAIVAYMHDHLFVNLPLKHYAEQAGLSENQFIRRFSKAMQCTPLEYIRKVKVERAEELLQETDLNISQIANLLHYSSLYSFSRSFKTIKGVSPQKYRTSNGDSS
jgi:AraC-like DNA-binding protein